MQHHRRQPTRLPRPWDSPGKNIGVGCHFLLQCMKVKSESEVTQSCPTLCDPMDCSLPGSSIHRIFQARVLEWGAIAFSVLHCRQILYRWATREVQHIHTTVCKINNKDLLHSTGNSTPYFVIRYQKKYLKKNVHIDTVSYFKGIFFSRAYWNSSTIKMRGNQPNRRMWHLVKWGFTTGEIQMQPLNW